MCKEPNFEYQLHEATCHLRFQRRAGSINRPLYTCTRVRRCPVALCATSKRKIRKQVFFFVCKVPDFAYQLYGGMCHLGLQRRPVSANRRVLSFEGWPPCSLAICAKIGGNQVTDCHPVGGIFCLRPAAAKLHLAYQKVVLFAQPSANSLLSQNRKHSASLTASLFVPAGC